MCRHCLMMRTFPVFNFGHVIQVGTNVFPVLPEFCFAKVDKFPGAFVGASGSPHCLHCQVIPAHLVKYHHIKRCGSGAFFHISPYMKSLGERPAVYEVVDDSHITMERKYYICCIGKQFMK
jgi:hypothetical protein